MQADGGDQQALVVYEETQRHTVGTAGGRQAVIGRFHEHAQADGIRVEGGVGGLPAPGPHVADDAEVEVAAVHVHRQAAAAEVGSHGAR